MTQQEVKILQEQANEAKKVMIQYYNERNWEDHKTACATVRTFRELFEALGLKWEEGYFNLNEIEIEEEITIQFYVECFDRYANFTVSKDMVQKTNEVLYETYMDWLDDCKDECCEESLCRNLQETGIHFIYEMSDYSKYEYLEQLLYELKCESAGYCCGCDGYEDNQAKIEALEWAVKYIKKEIRD